MTHPAVQRHKQTEIERIANQLKADFARICAERDRVVALNTRLTEALRILDTAIVDKGPNPDYHDNQLGRLLDEWPTLLNAIQGARALLAEGET